MNIIADYHMHTHFSEDSQTPMEAMILGAARKGLKYICFTEHMDLDYPPAHGTFQADLDAYQRELLPLKAAYQDTIQVGHGVELGMQPHLAARNRDLAKKYPFDFIIASMHLLSGLDVYYPEAWENRPESAVIADYFKELLFCLQSMEAYDTLGHLDYIIRYSPTRNQNHSYERYGEYIDPILQHLIDNHKCLEVNTAGLKYGLGQPNPDTFILKRYRELGGHLITIGSDAHKPEHIAYDFPVVQKLLISLGFDSYTIFRNREPLALPLK